MRHYAENINFIGILGFFKGSKKMVAGANFSFFITIGRSDNFYRRFCHSSFYLYLVLVFIFILFLALHGSEKNIDLNSLLYSGFYPSSGIFRLLVVFPFKCAPWMRLPRR